VLKDNFFEKGRRRRRRRRRRRKRRRRFVVPRPGTTLSHLVTIIGNIGQKAQLAKCMKCLNHGLFVTFFTT
jgi:hypothetical protein